MSNIANGRQNYENLIIVGIDELQPRFDRLNVLTVHMLFFILLEHIDKQTN